MNQLTGDTEIPFGVVVNENDNLSYVSWAQQALHGIYPFSILYTTSPHSSLLINPLFLVLGKLAALFSLHPLFIMNVTGLFFSILAVIFLYLLCKNIGMSDYGAFLCTALTIFGSGISWLPWILGHSLNLRLPVGGDLYYFDLFPVTAFVFYPFNTVGISLSAILLFCILKSEKLIYKKKKYGFLFFTFLTGAALAAVRPYEPAVLLLSYFILIILLFFFSKDSYRLYTHFIIFATLISSLLPFEAYNYWVSKQNIWNNFATQSLSLFPGRFSWLLCFGLFWPMAFGGIYLSIKMKNPNLYLLSIWSVFLFFLLILFGSDKTKLASSGFIALGILSGHFLNHLFTWMAQHRHNYIKKSRIIVFILVIISISLSNVIVFIFSRRPVIDPEIIKSAGIIRKLSRAAIPSVLTDVQTGRLLPGIAGIRVYAGHFALTDGWNKKIQLLNNAGFKEKKTKQVYNLSNIQQNFENLTKQERFDYILIKKSQIIFPAIVDNLKEYIVYNGDRWIIVNTNELQSHYADTPTRKYSSEP